MLADHVWYKDGATVVAAVALAVSLVSSVISMWHTEAQDKQSAHLDLRTVLQRLLALPKESIDLRDKYNGREEFIYVIDDLLSQEKTFLTSQGAVLARRLGPKLVSTPEYLTLARALGEIPNPAAQNEFVDQAWKAADTANDAVAALQAAGFIRFARGDFEDGRAKLGQVLKVFDTYKGFDPAMIAYTYARTRLAWAGLEFTNGYEAEAKQQLQQAADTLGRAPTSPNGEMLKQQIADFWNAARPPVVTNPALKPVTGTTPLIDGAAISS